MIESTEDRKYAAADKGFRKKNHLLYEFVFTAAQTHKKRGLLQPLLYELYELAEFFLCQGDSAGHLVVVRAPVADVVLRVHSVPADKVDFACPSGLLFVDDSDALDDFVVN